MNSPPALPSRHRVLLVGLLLWTVLVRAWDLPLWWLNGDEGIYFDIATATPEVARRAIEENAHPPLYYYLERGLAAISPQLWVLRLPALVAGTLLVALTYVVGTGLGGTTAGLLAAALVAQSPGAIMQSQVMRPYSLMLCLWMLAGAALVHRFRGRWWVVAAAGSGALLLHYSSLLVAAGFALAVLLAWFQGQGRGAERPAVLAGVAWLVTAMALYVSHIRPVLQGGALQERHRDVWMRAHYVADLGAVPAAVGRAWQYSLGYWLAPVVGVAIGLAWLLTWRRRPDQPTPAPLPTRSLDRTVYSVLALVLAVAVALSSSGQYPLGRSRHSLYLLLFIAPAAGVAGARLFAGSSAWQRGTGRVVLLALLGGLVLASLPDHHLHRRRLLKELTVPREQVDQVMAALQNSTAAGDVVVVDLQTYYLMQPLLRERLDGPAIGNPAEGVCFQSLDRWWVCASHWKLEAAMAKAAQPGHLLRLLELTRRGLSDTAAGSRRYWVMQGGWGVGRGAATPPFAEQVPAASGDLRLWSGPQGGEQFRLYRLFLPAYRRWLSRSL